MTNPVLLILIERLLWPIPRVRWEAARNLARLIREDNREAASALLGWIHTRRLESEAVHGLNIIDAFELGDYFKFSDVSESIRAPSLLSDFLLKRNFSDANGLIPTRYIRSPSRPSTLPHYQEVWFDQYREIAVSPIFSDKLTQLQEATGFPFMLGWQYDWRWLQATHPRPEARHPHFFTSVHRKYVRQFHCGQRELYISAYLRTLGFATITEAIPLEVAEKYATYALTLNRGFADLEPIERPDWAQNLLPIDSGSTKELAQKIWTKAEASTSPGEALLALKVVDVEDDCFIEFDTILCIGPSGFVEKSAEAETFKEIIVDESPGEMAGLVGRDTDVDSLAIETPLAMTQEITPEALGSVHIDMASNIRLASPYIFGKSANVQCGPSEIRLEAGIDVLSCWIHWYAEWRPTLPRDLGSTVCSMTTVSKSSLDRFRASCGMKVARLVRVRRAARGEIHREPEVKTESYWM